MRYSSLAAVLAAGPAVVLAGCGAVVTVAAGGALALSGGGGGGAVANSVPAVPTTQIVGDTSGGSATLHLVVTDAESDAARLEIRYSTDANESAVAVFARTATGTLRAAGATAPSQGSVPTSPGGTSYDFTWNTAQDLGTTLNGQVRLQVIVDGRVGNTTSTFAVDNTTLPVVTSATLSLPAGATAFADEQGGRGFVPVSLVLADAESSRVTLSALVSTDGGRTFPLVAAGVLVDGAGTAVPTNAIPTTPGGTGYVFQFRSVANALGASGPTVVVLRFQVSDTKSGKPLDTTPFQVDNADFSAIVTTPSGSLVAEGVDLPFLLVDAAAESLDVAVDWTVTPGAPSSSFAPATPLVQPPFQGTTGLASTTTGRTQHFVWNAHYDTFVRSGVVSTATAKVRFFVTRPSTRVTRGPFPTAAFTVDQRLVETIYGKTGGVSDNVAADQSPLGAPVWVAYALSKVYFADFFTRRVRVVDLATGLIDTALGGGSARSSGTAARDYSLQEPAGLAAAPNGTLFVGESFSDSNGTPSYSIVRVDGSTPTVTGVRSASGPRLLDLAYDALSNQIFFATTGPNQVNVVQPNGFGFQAVIGGSGAQSVDDAGTLVARTLASVQPEHVAANFAGLPDLVLVAERNAGRILAANVGTANASVFGLTIPPGFVRTVKTKTTDPLIGRPEGLAIDGSGNVFLVTDAYVLVRLSAADGSSTRVAGLLGQFGYGGDGGPATSALLSFPTHVAVVAPDELLIADQYNSRVRRVDPSGIITTVAGGSRPNGDGGLAAPAFFRVPMSVALGGAGLLVADPLLSQVRQIDTATTAISAYAGDGRSGASGDGGAPVAAALGGAFGLARSAAGDVYVSQFASSVVRRVRGGVITTAAGTAGVAGFSADQTPLATTLLRQPVALAAHGSCVAVGTVESQVVVLNDGTSAVTSWGLGALPGGGLAPGASARVAGDASVAVVVTPTNGALARAVTFLTPVGVAMAGNGDLYVADGQWHAVFRVQAATGQVAIVAGKPGTRGFNGDGIATTTSLDSPNAVALDPAERVLYVQDARNARIRMVNLGASPVTLHGVTVPVGELRTIIGATQTGADGLVPAAVGGLPNGGAVNAPLDPIEGVGVNLAADGDGRLYFSDGQARVRYVDAIGTSYALAGFDAVDGSPAAATFMRRPSAIAVLPDGSRYFVVDSGRIRVVDPADTVVRAYAGTGQQTSAGNGGPLADASFAFYASKDPMTDALDTGTSGPNGPRQIAFSTTAFVTSLVAIADTTAHAVRLGNVGTAAFVHTALALNLAPGQIVVLAGASTVTPEGIAVPTSGSAGDGVLAGPATRFCWPSGVAFTSSGILLVADTGNDRVRAVNLTSATVAVGRALLLAPGTIDTAFDAGGNMQMPLRSPRALAFEPFTHVVVCQHGGSGVVPPQITALNPHPVAAVTAFGRSVPARGSLRIDSSLNAFQGFNGYLAPGDVPRGVAIVPSTGDCLFCVRDGSPPGAPGSRSHQVAMILNKRGGISGQTFELAGNSPVAGFDGDGGVPDAATFNGPCDVAVDALGTIYVLDARNLRVRRFRVFP